MLSARVVRAAPDDIEANQMRAGSCAARAGSDAWEAGPRSLGRRRRAVLREATHFERAAALHAAPEMKGRLEAIVYLCGLPHLPSFTIKRRFRFWLRRRPWLCETDVPG